jgi:hypothetical protein
VNISDIFFTSSVEAPKLQRPPETFVPYTEKTITERTAQKWFVRFKQGNFDMTLRAWGGIWWDMKRMVHYELPERNLTVTAERYCQRRRLEEAIQQKRPGRRHSSA